MKQVNFVFRGRSYRCSVAVSTEEYPHYYWCYIDDPELAEEVGDCISYKMEAGEPLQPSELYAEEYRGLVEEIKDKVVQLLAINTFARSSG